MASTDAEKSRLLLRFRSRRLLLLLVILTVLPSGIATQRAYAQTEDPWNGTVEVRPSTLTLTKGGWSPDAGAASPVPVSAAGAGEGSVDTCAEMAGFAG